MKSIENVLDDKDFKELRDTIMSPSFPWYYRPITTYHLYENDSDLQDGSFTHWALSHEGNQSQYMDLILPVLVKCLEKSGQFNIPGTEVKITRIKVGMHMLTTKEYIHTPHVDDDHYKHYAGLFYINDSTAPTVCWDEYYDSSSGLNSFDYMNTIKLTNPQKHYPKANSFCWFDGWRYHAGSSPTDAKNRVVINFNYTVV